ncbi:MAG: hypothetical protein WBH01_06050 [Dehalococcoidia bacterium]
MIDDDLISRVQRLYRAIKETEETDISRCKPTVTSDGKRVCFYQDWRGGRSDAELANTIYILIYNIANLRDLLKKWAIQNGKATAKVDDAFKNSLALRIMKDLSNNDRHGYDPKKPGHSGRAPRVDNITTVMRMTTKPEKGALMSLTFDPQGVPLVTGSGTATVIITGDILDRDGNKISDLHKTMLEAVEVWESILDDLDVNL